MQTLRQLCKDKIALTSLIVVSSYLFMAVAIEAYEYSCLNRGITPIYARDNMKQRFTPPSPANLMGTDYLGRDVLWRAVAGSATAVKVGVSAALISAAIGVTLGVVAGYFGGKTDEFVVWLYSTFASMPTLLFILAFALLATKGFLCPSIATALNRFAVGINSDPGMMAVYVAIGITGWVTLCRVVRAETLKLREAGYVQAARVAGASHYRIIIRHVLPNLFHLVIIYFTLRFAYAIMIEVMVSYLGLGVQLAPSWGVMISDGQEGLWRGVWWEVAAATGFMFILVLALHLLGDALRDALDPRMKNR